MTLENQSIPQFFLLLGLGLALVIIGVSFVADYRGLLTRYVHLLWRPDFFDNEARVRLAIRIPAGTAAVLGMLLVILQLAALASGHIV